MAPLVWNAPLNIIGGVLANVSGDASLPGTYLRFPLHFRRRRVRSTLRYYRTIFRWSEGDSKLRRTPSVTRSRQEGFCPPSREFTFRGVKLRPTLTACDTGRRNFPASSLLFQAGIRLFRSRRPSLPSPLKAPASRGGGENRGCCEMSRSRQMIRSKSPFPVEFTR